MSEHGEIFYEKCEDCNCETFRVRVTPLGVCASDTDWICTECGEAIGGIINDPLNELSVNTEHFGKNRNSEFLTKGDKG